MYFSSFCCDFEHLSILCRLYFKDGHFSELTMSHLNFRTFVHTNFSKDLMVYVESIVKTEIALFGTSPAGQTLYLQTNKNRIRRAM